MTLETYTSYKESGIEWLGEIPEHWEVKKLKFISKIVLGKMICNTKSGHMELKPYLKSKNIQWLKVDLESVDEMWFTQKEMKEYKLKIDDIILSEGGEVGKACIWKNELPECYIQNSAHKVTVNSSCIPHYYLYLFSHIGYKGVFE
jgi:type I restriction enzyme S subunit